MYGSITPLSGTELLLFGVLAHGLSLVDFLLENVEFSNEN